MPINQRESRKASLNTGGQGAVQRPRPQPCREKQDISTSTVASSASAAVPINNNLEMQPVRSSSSVFAADQSIALEFSTIQNQAIAARLLDSEKTHNDPLREIKFDRHLFGKSMRVTDYAEAADAQCLLREEVNFSNDEAFELDVFAFQERRWDSYDLKSETDARNCIEAISYPRIEGSKVNVL